MKRQLFLLLGSMVGLNAAYSTETLYTRAVETKGVSESPSVVTSHDSGGRDVVRAKKKNQSFAFTPRQTAVSTSDVIISPEKGNGIQILGLEVGSELEAVIENAIIAFPQESPFVKAKVTSGVLSGAILLGSARLEDASQRVFLDFTKAYLPKLKRSLSIRGQGTSNSGQPWFVGKVHSRELEYFTGDFLFSMSRAYFEGQVDRQTNVLGQTTDIPTMKTAVNKGLSAGSQELANRFREKLKRNPEFAEIRGPIDLKILITEEPKL